MEQITLGQIASAIALIVAIVGGVSTIITILLRNVKKYMTIVVKAELDPIRESLDKMDSSISDLEKDVKKVDMEGCKNFIVRFLADVEQGNLIDEIERERFYEQYKHYETQGGNGYIHAKVDKLKSKGLL